MKQVAPVAAAFAIVFAAAPAAALCVINFTGETTFDGLEVPQNGQLRIVGSIEVISPGVLTDAEGTQHPYTVSDDALTSLLVPDAPLPPAAYVLESFNAPLTFTVSAAVDDTAPAAPVATIEPNFAPRPLPFLTPRCSTGVPEYFLRVNGDDGDVVLVDGVARGVVRDGRAELGIGTDIVDVELLDLAGNLGESIRVRASDEAGGCSQGPSASALALLGVLLLVRRRRR